MADVTRQQRRPAATLAKRARASAAALWRAVRALVAWMTASGAANLILAMGVGLVFGGYFVLRYGGYWAEQDTQFFILTTAGMLNAEHIVYPGAYSHGFSFPAWAGTLSLLTGIEVGPLLRLYLPVVGSTLVALASYATFRRMLGSDRLGMLATLVLFWVPEMVLSVSRGNHEKLTITLMLLASLALLRSFSAMARRERWYYPWVVTYYVTVFALITVNIVWGSIFLVAWTVCFLFLSVITFRRRAVPDLVEAARRVSLVTTTAWIFVFLHAWYLYLPTQDTLDVLRAAYEGLLTLGQEGSEVADPYREIDRRWTHQGVYQALSAFRWVLFAGSFVVGVVFAWRSLRNPKQFPFGLLVLVGIYLAFGLELAVAIPVDLIGLEAGSNLQVRIFTFFALFAAPLFTLGVARLLELLRRRFRPWVARSVVLGAILFFPVTSLMKATLDPTASNQWLFYQPHEVVAMQTWAEKVEHNALWIGPGYRLWFAWVSETSRPLPHGNSVDFDDPNPSTSYALHSRIKEREAGAWRYTLSPILLESRIYDNGEAQIFYRRQRTPFQN